MRFQKGQMAIEYLTTYGWAIIVLLGVVAFLFASGLFSPSRFVNPECSFQPDLPCSSFILTKGAGNTAQLKFALGNGLGFPVVIKSISASSDYLSAPTSTTLSPVSPNVMQQGDTLLVTMNFNSPGKTVVRGTIARINISATYCNCATATSLTQCRNGCSAGTGGSQHTISGRVTTQVE